MIHDRRRQPLRLRRDDRRARSHFTTQQGTLPIALRPKIKPLTFRRRAGARARYRLTADAITGSAGRVDASLRPAVLARRNRSRRSRTCSALERDGFASSQITISYDDPRDAYTLRLGTLKKDLSIETSPTGASLTLDGVDVGVAPVRLSDQPFPYDVGRDAFTPRVIVANKPGYPPTRIEIGYDDGKRDYTVPLGTFSKTVRIVTEPADARVKLDGKVLPRDADGARLATLEFKPINDAGDLKTYAIESNVDHPGELWRPLKQTLSWDDGKTAYTLRLAEILIRAVPTRRVDFGFADGRWSPSLVESTTAAFKDVGDGKLGHATRVTDLPEGTSLDSFAISPDGQQLAYSVIESTDVTKRPRARLYVRRIDGVGGATSLTDGRQLDVTPTFSPDGASVVFSSDRAGGPMQVWSIPLDGLSGATRLTSGNADDLWPSLDSSPKPRVFYEALVPGQEQPRLYSTQAGTVFETDLIASGGMQPRLSPRNDAIAFVQRNDATGRTDVLRAGDKGGITQSLTASPDASERDPAWSPRRRADRAGRRPPARRPDEPAQRRDEPAEHAGRAHPDRRDRRRREARHAERRDRRPARLGPDRRRDLLSLEPRRQVGRLADRGKVVRDSPPETPRGRDDDLRAPPRLSLLQLFAELVEVFLREQLGFPVARTVGSRRLALGLVVFGAQDFVIDLAVDLRADQEDDGI